MVPFTSATKGARCPSGPRSYVGAPEFVMGSYADLKDIAEEYSAQGERVLLLASTTAAWTARPSPAPSPPWPWCALSTKSALRPRRPSATAEQGVAVKVISGDNALTVFPGGLRWHRGR